MMIGSFAKVKAGHDKGKIYLIINEESEYVYLIDGFHRTCENPKKKNRKHIQPILKYGNQTIKEQLVTKQPLNNEEIRKIVQEVMENV
ncbi:MAG: KOW domain-containing RNA-binding protein [Lachnospiraceae bacterium]|nr:KOW domain-containing RNA-binding protein [Lachnospiraceae bacterium]